MTRPSPSVPQQMSSAGFSPDGRFVLTTEYDGTAQVWDVDNGHLVSVLSTGSSIAVKGGAIRADDKFVVTANADGTSRIWEARTGYLVSILRGHTAPVNDASFSPDGSFKMQGG